MSSPLIPMAFKPGYIRGKVTLGRHVIVGSGSTILPGVRIEEGAAIGAHSLVSRDCPSWGIYAGVPVRRIRDRARVVLELERCFLAEGREVGGS